MQDAEYLLLNHDEQQAHSAVTDTFLVLPFGVFLSLTISCLGLFFVNAGVTERARMERAWKESEERFQVVIENLNEGLIISSMEGELLHWNQAAMEMHGYDEKEDWRRRIAEFRDIFELATPEGVVLPVTEWPLSRIIRGETVRDCLIRIRRIGTDWERYFSYGGRIVKEPSGKALCFLTIFDVTERARAEERLRVSEQQLRSFVEQAPAAIALFDRNMVYLAASKRWAEEFTNGDVDLIGRCHYEVLPDLPEYWKGIHRQGLAGISRKSDEDHWMRADGEMHWYRWTVQPWQDTRGEIGGLIIVTENIGDRKHAERMQLENARLEAENRRVAEASRMKSDFLANMSHELRTPLNGIIGFAELLFDEMPGPLNRKQREYVADVLASGTHLLQLINDVLDLAKVEAGKLTFQPEQFALPRAIDEICAVVHGLAAKKSIVIKTSVSPELTQVSLDLHRFKQICYNLLSNAVKFTDTGGRVDIAVNPVDGDRFTVRVSDTGIGIKPEDMKRLFREFEQLEGGASRRFEGTGLGLALTKNLVEMQGGTISAESEFGKGSSFTVVLPREIPG
jgi:PAS domain S-box-containing protein